MLLNTYMEVTFLEKQLITYIRCSNKYISSLKKFPYFTFQISIIVNTFLKSFPDRNRFQNFEAYFFG